MKKSAFTLSEVLLTLTIIGVISAMTVPSLMNSIEDRKLQAQAKKAYNTLQNALNQKYALTRETAADTSSISIIKFLAGTAPVVLKSTDYNETNNSVQLPDGQIMAGPTGTSSVVCTGSACIVAVDLNGEDGPRFSRVASSGTAASGKTLTTFTYSNISSSSNCPLSSTAYKRACRDIIYFYVNDLTVRPYTDNNVTKRYFLGTTT